MASSFTTNKSLEKPGNGDYVDTWNVPVNGDMDIIDQAFGGVTNLNATAGSATLTTSQYRSLIVNVSGAMSASVTYTIPNGVGGHWIIRNTTTDASGGPWTVTFASGGGGNSVTVERNSPIQIYSDGTNIRYAVKDTNPGGSNTQVQYNSSGTFAGSANLTFNSGTNTLTTTNLSATAGSFTTASVSSTSTFGGTLTANGAVQINNTLNTTGNIACSANITASGNVTAFSDERLKMNVKPISAALHRIKQLRGVQYDRTDTGRFEIGVIAQEVENVFPEVVLTHEDGMKSVAYGNLVGALIEAVRELEERVRELEFKDKNCEGC